MKRNIIVLFLVLLCTVCYTETHEDKIRTLLIESRKPKVTYDESSPFPQVIYELVTMRKLNNYVNEEEIWLGVWLRNNHNDYYEFTIYFIHDDNIVNRKNITGMDDNFDRIFKFEGSILQQQIDSFRIVSGVGTGFIYDFNRDGINDILNFMQGGTGIYYGIETVKDDHKGTKLLLSIEKQDYEDVCPFEFIEYQEKRGIKVHEDYKIITDELDYYGDAIYEIHQRWSFYTWNETVGRYTREEGITSEELEKVNGSPDFFKHDLPVLSVESDKKQNEQIIISNHPDSDPETQELITSDQNNSLFPFPLLPIAGGALALIIVCVILIIKKKHNSLPEREETNDI